MQIPFSEYPGRHERHYRRKAGNPLFPDPMIVPNDAALLEAQRLDHEELVAFMTDLRELVQRAVDLRPNEESQVVLDLKADLDRAYEKASGLAEDQSGNKDAIRSLTAVIMASVRGAAAAGDGAAEHQLVEEDDARRIHYQLLEHPLVADLLAPDSVIRPDELAATLLSVSAPELGAALDLFDRDQLELLCRDARSIVVKAGEVAAAEAADRLTQMEKHLAELAGSAPSPRDAGATG